MSGCGFEQIPPASVGILFKASSGISQKILQPKVTWVGMYDRLIIYPTATRNASYVLNPGEGEKKGDNSIKASTLEGALLPIDVTVAWHVDPGNVTQAFQNFGSEDLDDIQRKNIRWLTNYGVNNITGKKSIFDILTKDRAHLGAEILDEVKPVAATWGLTVDNVYVGEMHPPAEIDQKIQERTTAANDLQIAKTDQKKAITEAQTTLIEAQRQAEQNRLLGSQGTDTTLALKRLEIRKKAIEKWAKAGGHMPQIGEAKIPFTNVQIR